MSTMQKHKRMKAKWRKKIKIWKQYLKYTCVSFMLSDYLQNVYFENFMINCVESLVTIVLYIIVVNNKFFSCLSLSHVVTGLAPGETYLFRVRAHNRHGASNPSSETPPFTPPPHTHDHGKWFITRL